MPPGSPETPSPENSQQESREVTLSNGDVIEVNTESEILEEINAEAGDRFRETGRERVVEVVGATESPSGDREVVLEVQQPNAEDSIYEEGEIITIAPVAIDNIYERLIPADSLDVAPIPRERLDDPSESEREIIDDIDLEIGSTYKVEESSRLENGATVQFRGLDFEDDPTFQILEGQRVGSGRYIPLSSLQDSQTVLSPVSLEGEIPPGKFKIESDVLIDTEDVGPIDNQASYGSPESADPNADKLDEIGLEAGKFYAVDNINGYDVVQVIGVDNDGDLVLQGVQARRGNGIDQENPDTFYTSIIDPQAYEEVTFTTADGERFYPDGSVEEVTKDVDSERYTEEPQTQTIQPEGLAEVEIQKEARILDKYDLEAGSEYFVSGEGNFAGDTVKILGAKDGDVFVEVVDSEDFPDSVGETTVLPEAQLDLYEFQGSIISVDDLAQEPNPDFADQELTDREERIFGELGLEKGGVYRIKDDSNLRIDADIVQARSVYGDADPRFRILAGLDAGATPAYVRIDNIRESIDEFVPIRVDDFEGLSESPDTETFEDEPSSFEAELTKINKRGVILDIDNLFDDDTDVEQLLRDKYEDAEETFADRYISRVQKADPDSEILEELGVEAGKIYRVEDTGQALSASAIQVIGFDSDANELVASFVDGDGNDSGIYSLAREVFADFVLADDEAYQLSTGETIDSTGREVNPNSELLTERDLVAGNTYDVENEQTLVEISKIKVLGATEDGDIRVQITDSESDGLEGEVVSLSELGSPELSQGEEVGQNEQSQGQNQAFGVDLVEVDALDSSQSNNVSENSADPESSLLAELNLEAGAIYQLDGNPFRVSPDVLQVIGEDSDGDLIVKILEGDQAGEVEYLKESIGRVSYNREKLTKISRKNKDGQLEILEPQQYESVQFTEVTLPNGETALRSLKPRDGKYLLANNVFVPPEEPGGQAQKAIPNLDSNKTYSVKTNFEGSRYPDFDEDTYTPVRIETQDRDLEQLAEREYEAAKERTRRITDSRALQTVLDIARSDADLWEEIKPVIDRFDDFKEGTANPDESHRDLTALFTALEKSERPRELLQMAIEREFKRQSEAFKDLLRENGNEASVPTLVIGSGVQGQILNSQRFADNPEVLNLTVDASERAGGQFTEPGDDFFTWASWYINSRNRPYDREKPNRPGTAGSINPLGDKAVLQLSDISGQTYPSQDDLSDAVRVNQFLSTQMALNTEVTDIDRSGEQAEVTMTDTETGEEFVIRADQAYLTTGLGEERIGLDTDDEQTQEILDEEQEKAESGEQPQVLTFPEFMSRITNKSERFPLKDIKDITFVGWGDSTRVALEAVLGYGPEDNRNSMQLDRVEEVNVIGGDVPTTRQEYLDRLGNNLQRNEDGPGERPRYAQLADEWPRPDVENQEGFEEFDEYNFRVNPFQGRGEVLRRSGEDEEKVRVNGEFFGDTEADLVVVATGFESQIDELTENLQQETFEPPEASPGEITATRARFFDNASELELSFSGQEIGEVSKASEVRAQLNDDEVNVEFIFGNGGTDKTSFSRPDDTRALGQILEVEKADEVVARFPINNVYDEEVDDAPIGKKFASSPVYIGGPATDLELTEAEKEQDPVLAAIGENAVSIFRYADKTEAFGRKAAEREREDPNTDDSFIKDTVSLANTPTLPNSATGEVVLEAESRTHSFAVSKNSIDELPYDVDSDDLMRLVVGEYFQDVVIGADADLDNLQLDIERVGYDEEEFADEEEAVGFQLQTNFAGADADIAGSLMNSLQSDDAFISIIERITDEDSREEMSIIIPVDQSSGAVRVAEIRTENPTRTSTNIESSTGGDRDTDTRPVTPDW